MKLNPTLAPWSPSRSRWTPAFLLLVVVLAALIVPNSRAGWAAAGALAAASICLPRSWAPSRLSALWRVASLASLAAFFLCLRQMASQMFGN